MTSKNPQTSSSVLAKEPMQVIEVPDKKVDSETENSKKPEKVDSSSSTTSSEFKKNKTEIDMDVIMSEELPANNET